MPAVTGKLRDIIGSRMHFKDAEILFTLNAPNVVGTGSYVGAIQPTEPVIVLPEEEDGSFTVDLNSTTSMVNLAWYTIQVRWQGKDAAATLIDFPDWRIVVPGAGGSLEQLITDANGIPGGTNGRMVWVSQSPPSRPRPWTLWLEQEPGPSPDPFDSRNTSILYEMRP